MAAAHHRRDDRSHTPRASTCLLWALLVVCLGATAARSEAASETQASNSPCPEPPSLRLNFEGIELDTAAQFLGELTGKHYVVEGSRPVTFDFIADDITVDEAERLLLSAALQLGCKVIESEGTVRIIKPPSDRTADCPRIICECDDASEHTIRAGDCTRGSERFCPWACKEAGWTGRRWSPK